MILKVIRQILDATARHKLSKLPGVELSSGSRIQCRKVRIDASHTLTVGPGSIVEALLVCERQGAAITIGEHSFIGNSVIISASSVSIGDDVLISWGCTIVDHDSHSINWEHRSNDVRNWYANKKDWTNVTTASVRIENKAWLGFNVSLLKGITVGEGAVVAACSVVTRDVPPYTVVAGNPAKIIRRLTDNV